MTSPSIYDNEAAMREARARDAAGSYAGWHKEEEDGALGYAHCLRVRGYEAEANLIESLTIENDILKSEMARLREALTFYANPEVYRPHPHGIGFDRRDISGIARAALSTSEDQA